MRKNLALFLLSPLLLASCSAPEASSSEDTTPKTCLGALKQLEGLTNYTLVSAKNFSPIKEEHITEKYYENNYTGYLSVKGGVCSFEYDGTTLTKSALLKKEDVALTLKDFVPSFEGVNYSSLEGKTDMTLDLKTKSIATRLLPKIGFSATDYTSLVSLSATLEDEATLNGFHCDLSFGNKANYTITFKDVGKTSVSFLENALKENDEAFTPTETEQAISDLFALDNFAQYRDLTGNNVMDTMDYFTEQYFLTDFTSEYATENPETAAAYTKGFLGIENKKMTYGGKELTFQGTYMFYKDTSALVPSLYLVTRENPSKPGYAEPSFKDNDSSDVVSIMNYPKNLMALNHWELFTDNKDDSFTTDNTSILVDFSNNFALEETGNSLSHLDIIYDKDEGKVTMNLYRKEGNYYEYVFADFGKTSVSWVDSFIRKNKLA